MKGMFKATAACVFAMAMAAPALADGPAAGPGDADLMADAKTTNDVLTYGMGPQAHRFSPLDKINTSNVARMVPAYAASLGGEKQRGQESQPIVYDGMIYVTGSYSRLFAFDARTGEKVWEYNARLPTMEPNRDYSIAAGGQLDLGTRIAAGALPRLSLRRAAPARSRRSGCRARPCGHPFASR